MVALNPMLCQAATIGQARVLFLSGEWVVERKLDGVRAYIEGGRLFDRRGVDITRKFPEFVGLEKVAAVLDGEIVAQSGEFNDVSGRMHLRDALKIRLSAKGCPARFVAFDMVSGEVWEKRWALLQRVYFHDGVPLWDWMRLVPSFVSLEEGWGKVLEGGWEGLVLKRRGSLYQEGKRSADWLKVKSWSEVVATFTKLDVHNKGCRLETVDGRSVNVNGAQAEEVIERFNRVGVVLGEVQFLVQSGSVAWRFPSWRGLV